MSVSGTTYTAEARALVSKGKHAALATVDAHGYPYTSLVAVLPLENGDVVLLLSDLAEHTKSLTRDPKASLLFSEPHMQPLEHPRVTLLGRVTKVAERGRYRAAYLERHPGAKVYIDFSDFHFYLLSAERLYFVGGFGRMGWVGVEAYRTD